MTRQLIVCAMLGLIGGMGIFTAAAPASAGAKSAKLYNVPAASAYFASASNICFSGKKE